MDNLGLMKWGDGTIALGFYLGVLATEHYILSHPAQFPGASVSATDIDTTRDELYYALLALERLDRDADAAFPSPCSTTPALNGFFLRDDVPADFYTPVAPDAGQVADGDAGMDPDLPGDPPPGGCGCRAQPGAPARPLLVLVAVLLRRRRR